MGVSGVDREFFARMKRDAEEVPCQTEDNHLVRFEYKSTGCFIEVARYLKFRNCESRFLLPVCEMRNWNRKTIPFRFLSFQVRIQIYRVFHRLTDLGWVD